MKDRAYAYYVERYCQSYRIVDDDGFSGPQWEAPPYLEREMPAHQGDGKENGLPSNRLAVGLIKHETRTVGLILPDITNVFSQRLLRASRMSYGSMDIIYCSVIPMIVMNKRFLLFV